MFTAFSLHSLVFRFKHSNSNKVCTVQCETYCMNPQKSPLFYLTIHQEMLRTITVLSNWICGCRFLTYDPAQRITAEDALRHDYFKEAPLPIDPAMFPTWPAKSELGHRKAAAASPKPPPGGHEYKQLVSRNCFTGLLQLFPESRALHVWMLNSLDKQ